MRSAFFPAADDDAREVTHTRRPSPSGTRIPKPVGKLKKVHVAPAVTVGHMLARPVRNYADLLELLPEEPRKGGGPPALGSWGAEPAADEELPISAPPPVPVARTTLYGDPTTGPAAGELRAPEAAPLQRSQSPDLSRVQPAESRAPPAGRLSHRSVEEITSAAAKLADSYPAPAPLRRSHPAVPVPEVIPSYPPSLASSLSIPPFASKRPPSGPASVAGAAYPPVQPPAGISVGPSPWPWMPWCVPGGPKPGPGPYVLVSPFQFAPPAPFGYQYPPARFPPQPHPQRAARPPPAVARPSERRDAAVNTSMSLGEGAFAAALAFKRSADVGCQPTPRGPAPDQLAAAVPSPPRVPPPEPAAAPAGPVTPPSPSESVEEGEERRRRLMAAREESLRALRAALAAGGVPSVSAPAPAPPAPAAPTPAPFSAAAASAPASFGAATGQVAAPAPASPLQAAARTSASRPLATAVAPASAPLVASPARASTSLAPAPASAPCLPPASPAPPPVPSTSSPAVARPLSTASSSAALSPPLSRLEASFASSCLSPPAPAPLSGDESDGSDGSAPSPTPDDFAATARLARPRALRSPAHEPPTPAAAAWTPPAKGADAGLEIPRIRYVPLSDDSDSEEGKDAGPPAAWAMRRHRAEPGRGWVPSASSLSHAEEEDHLLTVRLTMPTL